MKTTMKADRPTIQLLSMIRSPVCLQGSVKYISTNWFDDLKRLLKNTHYIYYLAR